MGSQVIANCECGVEVAIMIGRGMFNFETHCVFPCLCERCRAVVEVNLLAKKSVALIADQKKSFLMTIHHGSTLADHRYTYSTVF